MPYVSYVEVRGIPSVEKPEHSAACPILTYAWTFAIGQRYNVQISQTLSHLLKSTRRLQRQERILYAMLTEDLSAADFRTFPGMSSHATQDKKDYST